MPNYRRAWLPGGTFFFTLVTNQRRPIFMEESARHILKQAFAEGMKKAGKFEIVAFCLLPDHLHCIWTLPENDGDYSTRWKVIKAWFSHAYRKQGGTPGDLTASKIQKGEVGIWQRRFWEHLIRDLDDLNRHIDYIHYNPVKHGLVQSVNAW
jgi:putative transposase